MIANVVIYYIIPWCCCVVLVLCSAVLIMMGKQHPRGTVLENSIIASKRFLIFGHVRQNFHAQLQVRWRFIPVAFHELRMGYYGNLGSRGSGNMVLEPNRSRET